MYGNSKILQLQNKQTNKRGYIRKYNIKQGNDKFVQ